MTHITTPVLFHTERVKLLGTRIGQLKKGAVTKITKKDMDENIPYVPEEIAKKELELNLIPIKIIRTLPDGTKEYWKTEDFEYK